MHSISLATPSSASTSQNTCSWLINYAAEARKAPPLAEDSTLCHTACLAFHTFWISSVTSRETNSLARLGLRLLLHSVPHWLHVARAVARCARWKSRGAAWVRAVAYRSGCCTKRRLRHWLLAGCTSIYYLCCSLRAFVSVVASYYRFKVKIDADTLAGSPFPSVKL